MIQINVNNRGTMEISQAEHDGAINVTVWDAEHDGIKDVRSECNISAGDMVTLINWYRYQKDNGNTNLSF